MIITDGGLKDSLIWICQLRNWVAGWQAKDIRSELNSGVTHGTITGVTNLMIAALTGNAKPLKRHGGALAQIWVSLRPLS